MLKPTLTKIFIPAKNIKLPPAIAADSGVIEGSARFEKQ